MEASASVEDRATVEVAVSYADAHRAIFVSLMEASATVEDRATVEVAVSYAAHRAIFMSVMEASADGGSRCLLR